MAQPRGISEEEQRMYYLGLPSRPRLVARSSTAPWFIRPYHPWSGPPRKILIAVGSHPIVDIWNNNEILRQRIIDVLHQAEWHSIDILRIGYEEDERSQFPVVLFINIEPGSMTWELAHPMACQCKLILQHNGLQGVECEIKESRLVKLGLPNILQLETDAYPHTWETLHMLSDYTGTSIASIDQCWVEGTRGVLLRDTSDTEAIYALTCRHVCYGDSERGELLPETHTAAPTANPLPSKAVIQPGNGTLKEAGGLLQGFRDSSAAQYEEILQRHEDQRRQGILETLHAQLQETDSALTLIKERETPETRVLGTIAYAREYGIRDHGQLSDWCLVRLDPTCFQRPLSQFKSRVIVDQMPGLNQAHKMILKRNLDSGVLMLDGALPASEFAKQAGTLTTVMGKRGRTGLSFGYLNQVKSIVRHFDTKDRPGLTAIEWCVVSVGDSRTGCFSKAGDSGSCVWDMSGRVVAMITSGITRDDMLQGSDDYGLDVAVDVTYVTPMEWLLDDFRACGLELEMV